MDPRREWGTARNTVLYFDLMQIIARLNRLGIPVMALKGAISLIIPMHPELGQRQMGDLDLLVQEEDFESAERALTALGYRTSSPTDGKARTYVRSESVGPVDLHRHPVRTPWADLIDLPAFWSHAEVVSFGNHRVLIPSSEDQLWIQLIHICFHHQDLNRIFRDAELLRDVRAITAYYVSRLNWEDMLDWVRRTPYGDVLYVVLVAASRHFGMRLHDRLPQMKPEKTVRFERYIRWIREIESPPKWLYYAANRFLLILMVRGGWCARCRAAYDVLIRRSAFREQPSFLLWQYSLDRHSGIVWLLRGVHSVKMLLLQGIMMFWYARFLVK